MSFTTTVKEEILAAKVPEKSIKSFLSAIIHSEGNLSLTKNGLGFEVLSENKQLVNKTVKLVREFFGEETKIHIDDTISPNKRPAYIVKYEGVKATDILEDLRIIDRSDGLEIIFGIDEGLFENEADEKAYVVGAFLTCGSVTIPKGDKEGGYHLEFAFNNGIIADDFASVLLRCGFNPKFANRKDKCLIYFKDIESITDLVAYMGASASVLQLSEIAINRELRNLANRQRNCELANIDRSLEATERQLEAIEFLEREVGINNLDEKMVELINLKKKNDDLPLEELGKLFNPPISKSGVNHRMRKLMKLYKENNKD